MPIDDMTVEQARNVLIAHREEEHAQKVAALRPMIGKHFKYRNSYSADQSKWWLYATVTNVENGYATGWSFQKTPDGLIEIRKDQGFIGNEGWKEIDAVEFWKAANALLFDVTNILARPL